VKPLCAYCGAEMELPPATWLLRDGLEPEPVCAVCAFVPMEERPAPKVARPKEGQGKLWE
jgi:hypothetical protein